MAISTSSNFEFLPSSISTVGSIGGEPVRSPVPDQRVQKYLSALNSSIERGEANSNIANETRAFLRCDRVSVVGKCHGDFCLQAISGQHTINRRSSTTKCLEALAAKVLRAGQSFRYPAAPGSTFAPQIEPALEAFLTQSAARSLIIEPIYLVATPAAVETDRQAKTNEIIGGIVIEQIREEWKPQEHQESIAFALDQGATVFRHSHQHQKLFLYGLWNWLGKSKILAAPKSTSKTILAGIGILLLSLFLACWPTDFYVVSDGVIVPEITRNVYCQSNGMVDEVLVAHGDHVQAGEVICRLKSDDLEFRQQELAGRISQLEERLNAIRGDRFNARDQSEKVPRQENIKALKAQITSFQKQQGILLKMAEQLVVRSPITGQILTWDPVARLQDRPVKNGEQLFQIADVDGGWQLELDLADRRIGHVLRAIEQSETAKVPVSFVLAADPATRLHGEVCAIGLATEISVAKTQIIKLQVDIDEQSLPVRHARTGVTAKVVCGRASIGYLWLHDIGEFLNKHLLFRFAS